MKIEPLGNSVIANITKSPNNLNPQTKILPISGEVSALNTVDASMNIPNIQIDTSVDETENKDSGGTVSEVVNVPIIEPPRGWEIFANMGGGSLKFKAGDGAHVDMTTQSINWGFARSLESSAGKC